MSEFIKLISNVVDIVKNEFNSTTQCIYCNMPYLSLAIQLHQEICEQNPNNFDGSPKQDISSNGKITIYVLLLEDNRYYIGKSAVVNFRLEQHFDDCGSSWTKKYKPIKVIEVVPNSDTFDEDKYTLKYMSKYGVDVVRGGSFCQIKLSDQTIQIIEHMLNSIGDKCYNCEEIGHYSKECPNKIQTKNNMYHNCKEIGHYSKECPNKIQTKTKVIKCTRCGRNGHIINNCYAGKHINGMILYTENLGSKVHKFAIGKVYDDKVSHTYCTKNLEKNQVASSKSLCRYCQKQFTTTKGAIYHENIYCKKNPKRY